MNCAANDTITYLKPLAQNMAGFAPNYVVLSFLMDLKIPVSPYGFEYLRAAVLLRYENPMMDLANGIYLAIGATCGNVSSDVISAAIHRSIKTGFERSDPALWQLYLPSSVITGEHPPTNSEVIAGLARTLELWQGCAEAYLHQQYREVVSSANA